MKSPGDSVRLFSMSPMFAVGVWLILLGVSACGEYIDTPELEAELAGASESPVVYGVDNRQDVYAHSSASLRDRAEQATVALMSPSTINTSDPNNVTFNAQTLESARNLCSDQRFLSDPTAAFCSGTLIDDDLVLTAGHCITSASACADTRFVFNYYRPAAGTLNTVTTDDIYSCASIVVRQQGTVGSQNLDYAIVRLDRPAAPRFTPAPVRAGNSALSTGQNVAVIGCGSGVPFKIDSGGSVRDPRSSILDYFVASTDTFGGNSGSGVYEIQSFTVAGILVRGETDYVSEGSCNVVNVCAETGCRGEDITYVYPAVSAYCSVASSERLCGSTPPPPGDSYSFSATNTNSAQQNTVNKTLSLNAGDTIEVGTCGVAGASASGDTYLRFYSGSTQVAANDDSCSGLLSYFKYVVPAAGDYQIRAGCYGSNSCSGTVAWVITPGSGGSSGSFDYSASNTNSAQQNTTDVTVMLDAGQTLRAGTCTVPGSSGSGDTYLRLYNSSSSQVASNDDSCSLLSYFSYTASASGAYEIRAGCYSSNSCSGTVAYVIE